MLCVLCSVFWLIMHRYLLCKYKEPEAVILHVDSKSANLGPRLILFRNFKGKGPFQPNPVSVKNNSKKRIDLR